MLDANPSLIDIFSGWDGYQRSLVSAVTPLNEQNLIYRSMPDGRSVGEIASHIASGRIFWFRNMDAPGADDLLQRADFIGNRESDVSQSASEIVYWLQESWAMVENCLKLWTVGDLAHTYRHEYFGNTYEVSRQWTIWRIMCHDIHHGGQLTVLLAEQGIDPPDLGGNGGHIIEPPMVASADA